MDYVFFVGVGIILWECKKQQTIVLLTIEVEYMATNHYMNEAIWLRQILTNVGFMQEKPTSIMCNIIPFERN